MRALAWLARRWYIPLLVLAGLAGFVATLMILRRPSSPLKGTEDELAAIDAGEKAKLLEIKRGRDEANAAADLQYRRELDALDARQKRKAERLRRDPARRARFLARVSRKRPTDPI
jgi:hypothetical protein